MYDDLGSLGHGQFDQEVKRTIKARHSGLNMPRQAVEDPAVDVEARPG